MNKPLELLEEILLGYDKDASTTEASRYLDQVVTQIETFLGVTAKELQEDAN